jgi:hypothetical protein
MVFRLVDGKMRRYTNPEEEMKAMIEDEEREKRSREVVATSIM